LLLQSLGCLLIQLFLQARHARLDLTTWTQARGYGISEKNAERTLKTSCGEVTYQRAYLVPRSGGGPGVHPLDVALGLTRDGFSPLVIGWFCRLATRVSFRVASGLGEMFLGSAPPSSTIEEWVLGLGRPAYVFLSEGPLPAGDGDVLVIEIDGKAGHTAPYQALGRRGAVAAERGVSAVPWYRGRSAWRRPGTETRRRETRAKQPECHAGGDVHPAAGQDGRHGPLNKKVFGRLVHGVGPGGSAGGATRAVPRDRRGFGAARVDGGACLGSGCGDYSAARP
jgi:hypothetical protein